MNLPLIQITANGEKTLTLEKTVLANQNLIVYKKGKTESQARKVFEDNFEEVFEESNDPIEHKLFANIIDQPRTAVQKQLSEIIDTLEDDGYAWNDGNGKKQAEQAVEDWIAGNIEVIPENSFVGPTEKIKNPTKEDITKDNIEYLLKQQGIIKKKEVEEDEDNFGGTSLFD
ncbi:hypothetical protein KAU11_02310 [Candidatus Babeliales bacterium]|nr:hypothetical protein [Candidatus Babeliales bacterium]